MENIAPPASVPPPEVAPSIRYAPPPPSLIAPVIKQMFPEMGYPVFHEVANLPPGFTKSIALPAWTAPVEFKMTARGDMALIYPEKPEPEEIEDPVDQEIRDLYDATADETLPADLPVPEVLVPGQPDPVRETMQQVKDTVASLPAEMQADILALLGPDNTATGAEGDVTSVLIQRLQHLELSVRALQPRSGELPGTDIESWSTQDWLVVMDKWDITEVRGTKAAVRGLLSPDPLPEATPAQLPPGLEQISTLSMKRLLVAGTIKELEQGTRADLVDKLQRLLTFTQYEATKTEAVQPADHQLDRFDEDFGIAGMMNRIQELIRQLLKLINEENTAEEDAEAPSLLTLVPEPGEAGVDKVPSPVRDKQETIIATPRLRCVQPRLMKLAGQRLAA